MPRPRITSHRKKISFTLDEDSYSVLTYLGGENKSKFLDDVILHWLLTSSESGIYNKKYGGIAIAYYDGFYCFVDLNDEVIEEYGRFKSVTEILEKRKNIIEKNK